MNYFLFLLTTIILISILIEKFLNCVHKLDKICRALLAKLILSRIQLRPKKNRHKRKTLIKLSFINLKAYIENQFQQCTKNHRTTNLCSLLLICYMKKEIRYVRNSPLWGRVGLWYHLMSLSLSFSFSIIIIMQAAAPYMQ